LLLAAWHRKAEGRCKISPEMEIKKNKIFSYRFSIDLKSVPQGKVFLLEYTNIWQKSRGFLFVYFFLVIFKIHRLVLIFMWIFGCFKCVNFDKVVTNLKF
jgi:hypothetical protein